MADAPQIHPLRQRMIEDMTLRGINSASQKTYVRAVRACCTHVSTTPALSGADRFARGRAS